MYHNHPTRPMQRETAAPRSNRGRALGSSKTLTFNRAYKVMPVDLARPPRHRRRIASVEVLARRINQVALSANIVGMGYKLVAGTAHEELSDEVWMDLISLASKHGFSAPRLGLLERSTQVELTEEESTGLYAALERALLAGEPAERIAPEDDTLDRTMIHRVRHVLQQPVLKI